MAELFEKHYDRVGLMIKPCSDSCIGGCSYCYYYDPSKGKYSQELMPLDLLESYIRQFVELGCPQPMMSWQGGEPTLAGLDFFKRAVQWQQEYKSPGQRMQNAFQTCGLLLDEEWASFLAENNFLVGLSIDGPVDLHDLTRRDREGKPTHARAVAAYKMLQNAGAEVNILSVISSESIGRAGEIYRSLREIGCDFMQFIPCGPGRDGRGHNRLMVKGYEYGQFMLELMDAWIAEDNPKIFMRTNDNLLHLFFGLPCEYCQFRRGCLSMVTAEADGSLYPCDFFVTEKYCLGNIRGSSLREMVFNDIHQKFYHDTGCSHRLCKDCRWYRFCHGGCMRQRSGWQPRGKNMLCESMAVMFEGAFDRFDMLLSGRNKSAPNITSFLRDLVGRYGWPRESELKAPSGVKPVAGGVELHRRKK